MEKPWDFEGKSHRKVVEFDKSVTLMKWCCSEAAFQNPGGMYRKFPNKGAGRQGKTLGGAPIRE